MSVHNIQRFRKSGPLHIKHYDTNMQNEHITYNLKETSYTRQYPMCRCAHRALNNSLGGKRVKLGRKPTPVAYKLE